jgi:hypothetical protein
MPQSVQSLQTNAGSMVKSVWRNVRTVCSKALSAKFTADKNHGDSDTVTRRTKAGRTGDRPGDSEYQTIHYAADKILPTDPSANGESRGTHLTAYGKAYRGLTTIVSVVFPCAPPGYDQPTFNMRIRNHVNSDIFNLPDETAGSLTVHKFERHRTHAEVANAALRDLSMENGPPCTLDIGVVTPPPWATFKPYPEAEAEEEDDEDIPKCHCPTCSSAAGLEGSGEGMTMTQLSQFLAMLDNEARAP